MREKKFPFKTEISSTKINELENATSLEVYLLVNCKMQNFIFKFCLLLLQNN